MGSRATPPPHGLVARSIQPSFVRAQQRARHDQPSLSRSRFRVPGIAGLAKAAVVCRGVWNCCANCKPSSRRPRPIDPTPEKTTSQPAPRIPRRLPGARRSCFGESPRRNREPKPPGQAISLSPARCCSHDVATKHRVAAAACCLPARLSQRLQPECAKAGGAGEYPVMHSFPASCSLLRALEAPMALTRVR